MYRVLKKVNRRLPYWIHSFRFIRFFDSPQSQKRSPAPSSTTHHLALSVTLFFPDNTNAMIYLTTSPLYHTYLKGALGGGGAAYEGGAKTKFKFDKGSVDFGTDG